MGRTGGNTAVIQVGRLLEVRAASGYRTVADVDHIFDAIAAEEARLPGDQRVVVAVDWRRCPLMSAEAAERILVRITRTNARTERSAALASPTSSSALMQFLRLIRESKKPDRRLFYDPQELALWLDEVLSPTESARLRVFLTEAPSALPPRRLD